MESVFVEPLVGKVFEIIVQEGCKQISLVVNFRKDFEELKNRFEGINYFLNEEGSKQKPDVINWLNSLRDLAWQVEDIIEEYAVESMYGNIAQSCTLSCNQLIFRHRMGQRIKKIKAQLSSIVISGEEVKKLYDRVSLSQSSPSSSASAQAKKSSLFSRNSPPVGIESKVEDIQLLLEKPEVHVIAVVGMGGLGKTFLLRHVCNTIKSRFENSIWLSISKSYSVQKLQHDIASHIGLKDQMNEISVERAAELINRRLEGKRSLIVLDDLWEFSREDSLLDKLGLGGDKDCKVLISTRSDEVATTADAHIYKMGCLLSDDSWTLFCAHAFRECEGNSVPEKELQEVGREIVEKCGNLPLAIKTIGASLAKTKDPREWKLKLKQLKGQVFCPNDDLNPVINILKLSYDSLPAHLKACFAYLSFFPEDTEINCEDLVNLWIGEGLIPAQQDFILPRKEQWDMAWNCINQLVDLCLLEHWEDRSIHPTMSYKLTKYCKIHDLLHELAIKISTKNKCAFSVEELAGNGLRWCRILLAKTGVNDNALSQSRPAYLRTLSLSQNEEIRTVPANFLKDMKGLRVLDLSSTRISELPVSVAKMKLLKVLNLKDTEIKEVPKCVRNLKSLFFLALPKLIVNLPVWISEVKCLQHLQCEGINRMPKEISKLASLRILRSDMLELSTEEDEFTKLEDLTQMSELQELHLTFKHGMELKRIEEEIPKQLTKMRCLKIAWDGGDTSKFPQFPETIKAMIDLESLMLKSFSVPSWIYELANLRELNLNHCECSDYPELQRMSSLVSLSLFGNESCSKLPEAFGKSGGFPRLRFFTVWGFKKLEEFPELEEGTMACLEELDLSNCDNLKKVPNGLMQLKRLREFNYESSRMNECWKTLKEGGEYWNKIKAVNRYVNITIEG